MHRSIRLVVPLAAIALAGSGCLSQSHRIPNSELARLAQTEPKERGQRVRVIQGFANDDNPPGAPRVRGGTVIVVGGGHRHGGNRRGGGSPVNKKKLGKIKAEKAKDMVILAALVAIGVAATEGARYDGWVKVHPMHPVHLYGPHGQYGWVPLAQLDAETAQWARRAYIRPSEGPWNELGRAPLNRRGFTYSVLLGGGQIPSSAETNEAGFLSHIQFGYFPTKQIGLLFDTAYGWRDDEFANTVFDVRYGIELQALVLKAGKIHAGGFGNIGSAKLFDDGPGEDKADIAFAGGALLQLELTTRLAITARAGVAKVHNETVQDFTLGLSIY